MDSETDVDTISLCDSEISRENYKSPESSDCEGYATPLASSLTDISGTHGITIEVPQDADMESTLEAGERTPVSTPRAYSPPIVKQTMYLQKPRILVMTQREIHDESSEEEFFDADVQIRDVAQQLLNGVESAGEEGTNVTKKRADSPIMEVEETETDEIVSEEEEERATPVKIVEVFVVENSEPELLRMESHDEETLKIVQDITEDILTEIETSEKSVEETPVQLFVKAPAEKENAPEVSEVILIENSTDQKLSNELETEDKTAADELVSTTTLETGAAPLNTPTVTDELVSTTFSVIEAASLITPTVTDEVLKVAPTKISQDCKNIFDNCDNKNVNNLINDEVQDTQNQEDEEVVLLSENVVELSEEQETKKSVEIQSESVHNMEMEDASDAVLVVELPCLALEDNNEGIDPVEIELTNNKEEEAVQLPENEHFVTADQKTEEALLQESEKSITADIVLALKPLETQESTDRPALLYEDMPEVFSEITIAKTPSCEPQVACNPETIEHEPMTTLVNSDEVKTSSDIDMFSDCSPHEVKVDFDGYSSGKEESLSSSTSSESFEFAEPVSSNNTQEERTQAIRNSIIERYPSNDTDEDDLDSVGDGFNEDLLAVKQISAEVEQLVAAINAFGRDEEQQMSAYLVGKKMAAEKKRKSAMDTGVMTSSCHDQTVQTDNGSFILVDRHLPVAMESLQVEIDKLQADLEKVRCDEKELLKINSHLKLELEESQQTIDGIEVEAEQQYTELTSEIDELCEIVQRKDQELANIKEKVANLSMSEINLKDDVESQRIIVQRQKEIIESLREELDAITKKLGDVTKARDKAIEEATIYKMKNMERDRFLQREAQMSMEIEDLQRELNKQRLILNQTSMAKLADTFDRKVLHLENELRERDMLICKQNQIINSHRKSPTGSVITHRKMQPRASVLAAAGNLPSAGSSSESFQNGLDADAKEALLSFILSDRHNQLANIYNIGRILDWTPQEERSVERHLTKDRFA